MKKKFFRFFTIADWLEEETWLREQSKKGFKLCKMNPPAGYVFEKVEPEDVIYKLEYRNATAEFDCNQMYKDYGWEYCGTCFGWNYYRKPASQINSENEAELYSDKESKVAMLDRIIKTRLLPLLCLFFCCVIPNMTKLIRLSSRTAMLSDYILSGIFIALFIIYVYLILHCSSKLRKIKKDLE